MLGYGEYDVRSGYEERGTVLREQLLVRVQRPRPCHSNQNMLLELASTENAYLERT